MTTTMQTEKQAELTAIEMMIGSFVSAIDTSDLAAAEHYLHPEFRAMACNAASPGECQIISRESYIGLLASGKIGGQKRNITVDFVHINGTTATAFVVLENDQKLFRTYYNLIWKGHWQLISDMPVLTIK